jgi:hypothetical protein
MEKTICQKCGEEIEGYVATVNTFETWGEDRRTEQWCEECCEDNGMCKCDGCGEEFSEEFRMPRIGVGLYCVPCAREINPKHFRQTPIFYGLPMP